MEKLIRGVHQFQTNVFGTRRALFERLAVRQEPLALFVTCSDSRVNPALVTQTEPGDLFVLRNAGNLVPPHGAVADGGEEATIEYAVAALGVRDIVVCGHSDCGAMRALVSPDGARGLPSVCRWLTHAEPTRRILEEKYPELGGEDLVLAAVKENVLVQLEHLRTHPAVAAALDAGRLNLHGWVYRIVSGEVFAYEPERSAFAPLVGRLAASGTTVAATADGLAAEARGRFSAVGGSP